MARVVLARRARRELLKLGWPLIDAVQDALGLLEREPLAGRSLRGRLRGLRSLRIGTYRIIYQLADAEQTLQVAAIRHRSIAYRTDPAKNAARTPSRIAQSGGDRSASPQPSGRWTGSLAS